MLFRKKDIFGSINTKDKFLIVITVVFLVGFVLYQFVALPLSERKKTLQIEEQTYIEELNKLRDIGKEYIRYKNKYLILKRMIENKRGTSVLTYLDNMSQTVGIRENIDYIRPSDQIRDRDVVKNIVEIKIDAIAIGDLVKFMNLIENKRPGLLIYSIRLKPFFKDRNKTDAIIKIADVDMIE